MTKSKSSALASRNRDLIVKAFDLGGAGDSIGSSSAKQDPSEDRSGIFKKAQAIDPPYDPEALCEVFEASNSLRQNVDAYAVNIDGFGNRFEPALDMDQEDADEQISDAIVLERLHAKERTGNAVEDIESVVPGADEIEKRKKKVALEMRIELARLNSFFAFAAQDRSFPSLRKITRQDLEVLGNAYWEVLRDRGNRVRRLVWVPGWTIRLRNLIPEPIEVRERFQVSRLQYDTIAVKRQFRTFVQLVDSGEAIYFKEFGDPRTVSRKTGKVYPDIGSLRTAEPSTEPANEMIHFQIPNPRSPYGVPRWIGNLLAVLGSRSSEEVNYFYFENKSVPPMAILVSGGRLSKSSVPMIEDYIENNIKGRKNFHKILILEAVAPQGRGSESGPHPQRPMIEIKPLTDSQQQDALFQKYDERNMDKVGGSFRLPRLLRGESKDFNRATAEAALRMAEDQVFQPERDDFDFYINDRLLPVLGASLWRFKSNSPVTRDPETMGKLVAELVKQGVLTPAEGRLLAGDVFNRDFAVIKEAWAKQPIQFTLAGIQTGQAAPSTAPSEKGDLGSGDLASGGALQPAQSDPPSIPSISSNKDRIAQLMLRLRSQLEREIANEEKRALIEQRSSDDDGETIVLEVSRETMGEWLEQNQDSTIDA